MHKEEMKKVAADMYIFLIFLILMYFSFFLLIILEHLACHSLCGGR